jgi:hypothetical protein
MFVVHFLDDVACILSVSATTALLLVGFNAHKTLVPPLSLRFWKRHVM